MRWRRRQAVELKSPDQIALMRRAGVVVADALTTMRDAAVAGVSTGELDDIAREVLRAAGATSSFLHYDIGNGPYPAVICASVNDRVVHGIPSRTERLADGDIVSLDFGAAIEGWHADAAVSVLVGAVSDGVQALSRACEQALWSGLSRARAGGRLGDISHAVQASTQGAGPYAIVSGYGGHGIGSAMHMDPHVANEGRPGKGLRLRAGMALAVEPMLTLGGPSLREHPDGWTLSTADGSWSAHWEHTVAIMDDGPWVLTAHDAGRVGLAALGVTVSAAAAG